MPISHWVPVALSVEDDTPYLHWGDLGEIAFKEAFFDDTIRRWSQHGSTRVSRTRLDDLATLASDTLDPPRAIIFHSSRCGSSLTGRLLSEIPGMQVISEPAPVNSLLIDCHARYDPAALAQALGKLVRVIGRARSSGHRQFILKTSSWNVRYHALFRAAFPSVPLVWIHRRPAETLASLLRKPAGWMDVQQSPPFPDALFGIASEEAGCLSRGEFCARALTSLFASASRAVEGTMFVLNYADLPHTVWTDLMPFLGITLDCDLIARMRHMAGFDAKAGTPTPFRGSCPELSPDEAALLGHDVDRLYQRIEGRRQCIGSPCGVSSVVSGHRVDE